MAGAAAGAYYDEASVTAATFDTTDFSEDTKRQMSSLYFVSLDEAESAELSNILGQMGAIYGSYQVRNNRHAALQQQQQFTFTKSNRINRSINDDKHVII